MSQKKTLGTVTECTEICDDSVSLLGDTNLSVLNSARLLIGKEQIFIRIQMFLANLMRFKLFFFLLRGEAYFNMPSSKALMT